MSSKYLQREAVLAKIAAGETLEGFSLRLPRARREASTATPEQTAQVAARFPDPYVGRIVPFLISGPDRLDDGYAIDPAGWDCEEFERAPGVLWTHDRWSARIADSVIVPGNDALRALACFYTRDFSMALDEGFSWAIGELAAFRGYRASVGFAVVAAKLPDEETRKVIPWALDVSVARLREWSVLNMGMDDNAISAGRAAGLDVSPIATQMAKFLDEGTAIGIERAALERLWAATTPTRTITIDETPAPRPVDWRAEIRSAFAAL